MFVSKYTDDGVEIFAKYGDDAIAAVNACDAPYRAIQIIKNAAARSMASRLFRLLRSPGIRPLRFFLRFLLRNVLISLSNMTMMWLNIFARVILAIRK